MLFVLERGRRAVDREGSCRVDVAAEPESGDHAGARRTRATRSGQVGTPSSLQLSATRSERRRADLRRQRPAAGLVDQRDDAARSAARRPRRAPSTWSSPRATASTRRRRQLRLDDRRSGAAAVLKPPPPPAPMLRRRRGNLHGQRHGRHERAVQVGLRRRHAGHAPGRLEPTVTHTFAQPGIYYVTVTATTIAACRAVADHRPDRAPAAHREPADRVRATSRSRPRAAGNPRVGGEPGQRLGQRVRRRHQREARRDHGRHRAAHARRRAERPDLGRRTSSGARSASSTRRRCAVAQTIALPRASQPFGIAFAPTGSARSSRSRHRRSC